MTYMYWVGLALILGVFELLSMTSYLLWSALAAASVALLLWFFPTMSGTVQILIFSVMTVVSCLIWTRLNSKHLKKTEEPNLNQRAHQYLGRTVTLTQPIKDGVGHTFVDGIMWRVHCDHDLPAGTPVTILAIEEMSLKVMEKTITFNK